MQFALPPRKNASPYPSKRSSNSIFRRRPRIPISIWILGGAVILLILLVKRRGGSPVITNIPPGTPPVVLVTVFDGSLGDSFQNMIKENRRLYAAKHGYETFLPSASTYDLSEPPSPVSWAKVPAVRHAMATFPHTTYFFFLSQRALIANPTLSLEQHVVDRSRLESLMILDHPVVPPDSVIHTFKHRDANRVDLILTQDSDGLSQDSFILRRGDWAQFFLDAWFDPLYRSYNFQRAEGHALEHLVQWHGTVLLRLALIPQRAINAYWKGAQDSAYSDGDFVAHFMYCGTGPGKSCEAEAKPLYDNFVASMNQEKQ